MQAENLFLLINTKTKGTYVSTTAVNGKKSNKSVKYFHTFAFPYFLKHSS